MHRIPLSLPGKSAPDTPLVRLCRALGTHPYAVVLSALGWKPAPHAYKREDGDDLTWFVDSEVGRAHDLLTRCELPAGSPKSLEVTDPASPFLAGLCALENLAALQRWGRTGEAPAFASCGRFFRACGVLSGPGWGGEAQPVKAVLGFHHAAAITACGFRPWPELGAHGDQPLVAFAGESLTFPGLFLADIERVCLRPAGALAPRELPGFAPEEHPFSYALQSVLALAGFQAAQELARRHPRVVLKSRNSPASVIATQDALREGRRDTESFRDAVRRHLKKSAPVPA
jgi:hypothetical protein